MKKEVREGYKMTELGEIPSEWKILRLDELANIKRGASPRPISDSKWFTNEKNVGWIRISDVTNTKKFLNATEQYLSEEGIAKSRIVNKGDLIMSICATVGKPIILNMLACIHDGFVLFDNLNNNLINTQYLFYLLQKKEEEFKNMGQIGTQANLNTNIVGRTVISLPRLNEQEKIVKILSTVDKQIENTEKLIQKNQELKKGLMQQLLTKGIGHTEFKKTEIGNIPKVWKIVKLSEISAKYKNSIVDGPFGSNLKTDDYTENGVLVMQSSYITNGKFELKDAKYISQDKANELERSKVKAGDILMAKIGANFGMAEIIPKDFQYGILSSNSLKIDLDSDVALNELYIYILKYYKDKKFIDKLASTTAQPALSLKEIKNLKVPLFSINEQKKIALILLKLDEKIEQYKNKKEKIKDIKKGLMQQLFTGNIRVL
ncbi:restriction endonuclease subunit S [Clostridium perfringens]|uniref:restriction endonuclease subunit S n=1 Tax=Clostridium perfringens TaxID=1502 RepID=UPI001F48B477|nr:restriction endonuclease subunit S [Clostridium perfringens]MDM0630225.1 restriction endonuclease subunit S [Clostridium perfringens]MDM1024763.1 restriction endonuclease subunit S [Clostridium perfringens]